MIRRSARAAGLALAVLPGAWASCAFAQGDQARDQVLVPSGMVKDSDGRISINMAAGAGNQQLSGATVAVGDVAAVAGIARQTIATSDPGDRETLITVQDGAFAGNSGLLSVNISAGNQNQSANLAQLAVGNLMATSDELLEQSRASTEPKGGTTGAAADPNDTIHLSDGAFADNSGLVQVNLVGGERNSSANTFQLTGLAGNNPK